jgi:hypothetical protein
LSWAGSPARRCAGSRAAGRAALLARRQSAAQQYRWRTPLRWSGTKNSPHDMQLRCPVLTIVALERTRRARRAPRTNARRLGVRRDERRNRTTDTRIFKALPRSGGNESTRKIVVNQALTHSQAQWDVAWRGRQSVALPETAPEKRVLSRALREDFRGHRPHVESAMDWPLGEEGPPRFADLTTYCPSPLKRHPEAMRVHRWARARGVSRLDLVDPHVGL